MVTRFLLFFRLTDELGVAQVRKKNNTKLEKNKIKNQNKILKKNYSTYFEETSSKREKYYYKIKTGLYLLMRKCCSESEIKKQESHKTYPKNSKYEIRVIFIEKGAKITILRKKSNVKKSLQIMKKCKKHTKNRFKNHKNFKNHKRQILQNMHQRLKLIFFYLKNV